MSLDPSISRLNSSGVVTSQIIETPCDKRDGEEIIENELQLISDSVERIKRAFDKGRRAESMLQLQKKMEPLLKAIAES